MSAETDLLRAAEARQDALERARIKAFEDAKWLEEFRPNYIPVARRREIALTLRQLANIARSSICDADNAWVDGYMQCIAEYGLEVKE